MNPARTESVPLALIILPNAVIKQTMNQHPVSICLESNTTCPLCQSTVCKHMCTRVRVLGITAEIDLEAIPVPLTPSAMETVDTEKEVVLAGEAIQNAGPGCWYCYVTGKASVYYFGHCLKNNGVVSCPFLLQNRCLPRSKTSDKVRAGRSHKDLKKNVDDEQEMGMEM